MVNRYSPTTGIRWYGLIIGGIPVLLTGQFAEASDNKPTWINAQVVQIPSVPSGVERNDSPPSLSPLPEQPIQVVPPPAELLTPPNSEPVPNLDDIDIPSSIRIKQFRIDGSTVFTQADFDRATEGYRDREISLAELFEVRTKITELYQSKDYITSGAFIPPQRITKDGIALIQVVEGQVETIEVKGTTRLNQSYVRSRIAQFTGKPLNQKRLLEGLQLLRLNPLIGNLRAELSAGVQPGSSILSVEVTEAPTWNSQIVLDNNRSPSVGTDRRQIQLSNSNFLGFGDSASVSYTNTNGSNGVDLSYQIPLSPKNTLLSFSYGSSSNRVIEEPFSVLDIESKSRYYELTLQHPILQSPSEELQIGITASHRESEAKLLDDIPFPALGTDAEGRTRLTALRFFQSYTRRSDREVYAVRSQFSLGINALNATINQDAPDSRFFAWRGQAQYVKLLAPNSIFLVRGDIQLADRSILPFEQFGLGGAESVRGYRQDALLTDNGVFTSAEIRFPIARFSRESILLLSPFVDFGHVWNADGSNPPQQFLVSTGIGLRFQLSDRLTARFEWGIPLVSLEGRKRTWQENGLYFSVIYNPF